MKKYLSLLLFITFLLFYENSISQDYTYAVGIRYNFNLPDPPVGLTSYGKIEFEAPGVSANNLVIDFNNPGFKHDIGLNKTGIMYGHSNRLRESFTYGDLFWGFGGITVARITGYERYHRSYSFNQVKRVYQLGAPIVSCDRNYRYDDYYVENTCTSYSYQGYLLGSVNTDDCETDDETAYYPGLFNDVDYYRMSLSFTYIRTDETLKDNRSVNAGSISLDHAITRTNTFSIDSGADMHMIEVSISDGDTNSDNNDWKTMAFSGAGFKTTWYLSDFYTESNLNGKTLEFRGVVCSSYNWDADERVYTLNNAAGRLPFISSSPGLVEENTVTTPTTCHGSGDGSVTFTFDREIGSDSKMLINIINEAGIPTIQKFVQSTEFENSSFTSGNLPTGTYYLRYQTQTVADNSEVFNPETVEESEPFTINEQTEVTASPSPNPPLCSEDMGSIQVTASGGKELVVFNDDFESGIGWGIPIGFGTSALDAYDTTKSNSGLQSGKIVKITQGEEIVHSETWVTINNSEDTEYKYSGWVYSDGPSAELFFFMKEPVEQGYFTLVTSALTSVTNQWVYLEGSFMVPFNIKSINLRLDNNGGGTVLFDDVSIKKVSQENGIYTFYLLGDKELTFQGDTSTTSHTFNNLDPGNYQVVVSLDDDCESESKIVIIEEPTAGIAYNGENEIEYQDITNTTYPTATDGEIIVYFKDGTAPFTPSIKEVGDITDTILTNVTTGQATFKDLSEGTYEITITDDNGCSLTYENIKLESTPLPVITNIEVNDIKCFDANDGAIEVTVDGADKYLWSKKDDASFSSTNRSISNLSRGEYTLKAATFLGDFNIEGSYSTRTIEIGAGLSQLEIIKVELEDAVCSTDNATITVDVTGGTPNYYYKLGAFGSLIALPTNGIIPVDRSLSDTLSIQDENGCSVNYGNVQVTVPTEIIVNYIDQVNNTINGVSNGSIEIEVYGGYLDTANALGYTYTWKKDEVAFTPTMTYASEKLTATGLPKGSYELTVTDIEGCAIALITPVVITEPDVLTITPINIQTAINCNGGVGVLQTAATGGMLTYNYTWKRNGITLTDTDAVLENAISGEYTVEVSDGFTSKQTIIFEFVEPDKVSFITEVTNASCFGVANGSIKINPLGGNNTFEFSIDNKVSYTALSSLTDNTIQNLDRGEHIIWLRDTNGCEADAETIVTIEQPDVILIRELTNTIIEVRGDNTGKLEVSASGGTGDFSYEWTRALDVSYSALIPSIENLFADNYTLKVTDENNCEKELLFQVIQPEAIAVEIIETEPILCNGEATGVLTAIPEGGFPIAATVADYLFVWEKIEGTTIEEILSGYGENTLTGQPAGNYQVTIQDSKSATTFDDFILKEPELLRVTNGVINNETCFEEADGTIAINVSGGPKDELLGTYLDYTYVWIKQADATFTSTGKDISNLEAGIYEVTVTDANGCSQKLETEVELVNPKIDITNITSTNLSGFETNDGTITTEISGGTENLSFEWTSVSDATYLATTQNVSGLALGTYTLVVADESGCKQQIEQIIGQPELLEVNITVAQPNTCYDGNTADLTANVEGGFLLNTSDVYQYQWFKQDESGRFEELLGEFNAELRNQSFGTYQVIVTDSNRITAVNEIITDAPDELLIEVVFVKGIDCYGDENGIINVNVTGGPTDANGNYLDYIFSWTKEGNGRFNATTQNLSNLAPGFYNLSIVDSNLCTATTLSSIEVIDIDAPLEIVEVEKINSTGANSPNGSIDVNVIGGTAPYTYNWTSIDHPSFFETTQDISGLYRGLYALQVIDANNCETNYNRRIAIPGELVIENVMATNPICYNACTGDITIEVIGGLTPYSYRWSNGATTQNLDGICPGIYSVEVTDRVNVSTSMDIEIKNAPVFEIDLGEDITLCQGQLTTLDATTEDAVGYQWTSDIGFTSNEPQILVSETGLYSVTVTNADNCDTTDTIFVEATTTVISADFIAASTVFAGESFIIVNIADPLPDSLEWGIPAAAKVGSKDDTYVELEFDTPGTYEITLSVNLGLCYHELTKEVVVLEKSIEDEIAGVATVASFINFNMYPNPAVGGNVALDVETSSEVALSIRVFNPSSGRMIIERDTESYSKHNEVFDISGLPPGLYFVIVESSLGNQVLKLLIG